MAMNPHSQGSQPPGDWPVNLSSGTQNGPPDEGAMSDDDSHSSDMEQLVEPEHFERQFLERGDRLFSAHGFHSHGREEDLPFYPLPVDGPEHDRLDRQHDVLRAVIGNNYVGPVQQVLSRQPGEQRRVVDLCTGTGRWVVDMANEFPHARIRGLDIVPIQTRYPALNVQFVLHDVNRILRWETASVDLVHARSVSMAVSNYPQLLQEVSRILRPGGMFLSAEWTRTVTYHPDLDIGDATADVARALRFLDVVSNALWRTRRLQSVSDLVPGYLRDTGMFDLITPATHYIPIGDWDLDPHMQQQGEIFRELLVTYAHSLRPLLVSCGMPEAQVRNLIEGYTADLYGVRGLVGVYKTVYARRRVGA